MKATSTFLFDTTLSIGTWMKRTLLYGIEWTATLILVQLSLVSFPIPVSCLYTVLFTSASTNNNR